MNEGLNKLGTLVTPSGEAVAFRRKAAAQVFKLFQSMQRVFDKRNYGSKHTSSKAGANPMIQGSLDAGRDTTGLCTVRELAGYLLEGNQRECELCFEHNGTRMNVEVKITAVDGVATVPPPCARR